MAFKIYLERVLSIKQQFVSCFCVPTDLKNLTSEVNVEDCKLGSLCWKLHVVSRNIRRRGREICTLSSIYWKIIDSKFIDIKWSQDNEISTKVCYHACLISNILSLVGQDEKL